MGNIATTKPTTSPTKSPSPTPTPTTTPTQPPSNLCSILTCQNGYIKNQVAGATGICECVKLATSLPTIIPTSTPSNSCFTMTCPANTTKTQVAGATGVCYCAQGTVPPTPKPTLKPTPTEIPRAVKEDVAFPTPTIIPRLAKDDIAFPTASPNPTNKPSIFDKFRDAFGQGSIFENQTPSLGAEQPMIVPPKDVILSNNPQDITDFYQGVAISGGAGAALAAGTLAIPFIPQVGAILTLPTAGQASVITGVTKLVEAGTAAYLGLGALDCAVGFINEQPAIVGGIFGTTGMQSGSLCDSGGQLVLNGSLSDPIAFNNSVMNGTNLLKNTLKNVFTIPAITVSTDTNIIANEVPIALNNITIKPSGVVIDDVVITDVSNTANDIKAITSVSQPLPSSITSIQNQVINASTPNIFSGLTYQLPVINQALSPTTSTIGNLFGGNPVTVGASTQPDIPIQQSLDPITSFFRNGIDKIVARYSSNPNGYEGIQAIIADTIENYIPNVTEALKYEPEFIPVESKPTIVANEPVRPLPPIPASLINKGTGELLPQYAPQPNGYELSQLDSYFVGPQITDLNTALANSNPAPLPTLSVTPSQTLPEQVGNFVNNNIVQPLNNLITTGEFGTPLPTTLVTIDLASTRTPEIINVINDKFDALTSQDLTSTVDGFHRSGYFQEGNKTDYLFPDTSAMQTIKDKVSSGNTNLNVLDVGAARGAFVANVKSQFPNANMSALSAQDYRTVDNPLNGIDYRIGNADNITDIFDKNSFDVITSNMTMIHLTDPVGSIDQMYDLLKPNGILMVDGFDITGISDDQLLSLGQYLKNEGYDAKIELSISTDLRNSTETVDGIKSFQIVKGPKTLNLPIAYDHITPAGEIVYKYTGTTAPQTLPEQVVTSVTNGLTSAKNAVTGAVNKVTGLFGGGAPPPPAITTTSTNTNIVPNSTIPQVVNSPLYVSPSEAKDVLTYYEENYSPSNPLFNKFTGGQNTTGYQFELNGNKYIVKSIDRQGGYVDRVIKGQELANSRGLTITQTTFLTGSDGKTYAIETFVDGKKSIFLDKNLKNAIDLIKSKGLVIGDPKGAIIFSDKYGPVVIDKEGILDIHEAMIRVADAPLLAPSMKAWFTLEEAQQYTESITNIPPQTNTYQQTVPSVKLNTNNIPTGITPKMLPKLFGTIPRTSPLTETPIGPIPKEGTIQIDKLTPSTLGYQYDGKPLSDTVGITVVDDKIMVTSGVDRILVNKNSGENTVPFVFTPLSELSGSTQAKVARMAQGGEYIGRAIPTSFDSNFTVVSYPPAEIVGLSKVSVNPSTDTTLANIVNDIKTNAIKTTGNVAGQVTSYIYKNYPSNPLATVARNEILASVTPKKPIPLGKMINNQVAQCVEGARLCKVVLETLGFKPTIQVITNGNDYHAVLYVGNNVFADPTTGELLTINSINSKGYQLYNGKVNMENVNGLTPTPSLPESTPPVDKLDYLINKYNLVSNGDKKFIPLSDILDNNLTKEDVFNLSLKNNSKIIMDSGSNGPTIRVTAVPSTGIMTPEKYQAQTDVVAKINSLYTNYQKSLATREFRTPNGSRYAYLNDVLSENISPIDVKMLQVLNSSNISYEKDSWGKILIKVNSDIVPPPTTPSQPESTNGG